MKVRLIIILVLVLVIVSAFFFFRREKTIAGQVMDCQTNSPIVGATVTLNQSGWGFAGDLLWDKSYVYSTTSDSTGRFKVDFKVGRSANITTSKDGYFQAQQYEYPGNDKVIRMRVGDQPTKNTYNCKLYSECNVTTFENGVQVTKDVCFQ